MSILYGSQLRLVDTIKSSLSQDIGTGYIIAVICCAIMAFSLIIVIAGSKKHENGIGIQATGNPRRSVEEKIVWIVVSLVCAAIALCMMITTSIRLHRTRELEELLISECPQSLHVYKQAYNYSNANKLKSLIDIHDKNIIDTAMASLDACRGDVSGGHNEYTGGYLIRMDFHGLENRSLYIFAYDYNNSENRNEDVVEIRYGDFPGMTLGKYNNPEFLKWVKSVVVNRHEETGTLH